MALARFKDLCMDANDTGTVADFWGAALGRDVEHMADGDAVVRGDDPVDTIWVNAVSEPKVAKHRVHLDLRVGSLDPLLAAGATVITPASEAARWHVMADPGGGEFCAFVRDEMDDDAPGELFEVVVDTADSESSRALADWWAEVLGGTSTDDGRGFWWVEDVDSMPFESLDVVPVDEPKNGKNRVHWDLFCDDVRELKNRGATILRKPDPDVGWHVLRDPQGNEFCAFPSNPQ